jgi:O-antigen chain-terminating methyltransferase
MLETSDTEINVDRLMHEIREAVARERQWSVAPVETVSASLTHPTPTDEPQPHTRIAPPPLSLQPEFQARQGDRYHVSDLLKYHGGDFVRNAYRAVLKREPDAAGLTHNLNNLATGRFNKIDVLAGLRFSPEGERARVRIDGLAWPAAVRRLGRVPLIGYLLQWATAVGRLPLLLRHQRQSEFYLLAQQQQIADHVNQVHSQLAGALAQVSAQTVAGAEAAAGHRQLIESLSRQQQDAAERHAGLRDAVETRLADARRHLDQRAAVLTRQLGEQRQRAEEQTRQLLTRQQQLQAELVMQERRVALLLEEAGGRLPPASDERLLRLMASEEDHLLDPLYASFEDKFRGDREEIKERLRVYLPILKGAGVSEGALDIGCGRGEWLEILKDEGVTARGVDHNRVFVEQCRQNGLDVVGEDALAYLRSLPDQSLNAVTSFHLVEHLPFETLIKLLDEAVRTLKPGGLLILETPDPENFIVGSCNFYTDPTHRNPIPSPTLQFLLESRGLCRTEIMKLRPWDAAKIEGDEEIVRRFNEYFYSPPDYGIVGWKA